MDAGVESAESQNFAMNLLENAKVPGQTFSAIIASIARTEREKTYKDPKATILTSKADFIYNLGERFFAGREIKGV